jgi:hypothetical protein
MHMHVCMWDMAAFRVRGNPNGLVCGMWPGLHATHSHAVSSFARDASGVLALRCNVTCTA